MTTINSNTRQPTKLDYASPTQFKFTIIKLPKVEYFCTSVNIPGIELSSGGQQGTMLKERYSQVCNKNFCNINFSNFE